MNTFRKKGRKFLAFCGESWEKFEEDLCSFPRNMNFWASVETSIFRYFIITYVQSSSQTFQKLFQN